MLKLRCTFLSAWVVSLLLLGCDGASGGAPDPGVKDDVPPTNSDGAQEFVSDVAGEPGARASTGASGAAGAAATAPAANPAMDSNAGEAQDASRAIAEADIIQVQGDRLFALSAYSGLSIVDISEPAAMKILGSYRNSAQPFEMYLRGSVVYVMLNGFWTYEYVEDSDSMEWVSTARMQALDVRDPAHIALLGDHEIRGDVTDSRLVGDVLYLVTHENGWCWRCDREASTRITTFDVSKPEAFPQLDQLRFDDGQTGYGQRSISVTTDRIYVGGTDWSGDAGARSIRVVDISDPKGTLVLGAQVSIAGQITSRWQMDEYQGVLRVISQPGGWNSGLAPQVETFEIVSSQELTPLGSLTMRIPRNEVLQSTRFDGDRAYAITFERTDPLFTIDLSDPAAPAQVGELEMPGFVYHMEPRGNRVYGLGFDQQNPEGAMNVSVFDVTDIAHPTMLDRVNFGAQWAHAVEDQNRIHKAFNLMLDQGLVLVPFAGGGSGENDCDYRYESGIQIIDISGDDLSLRGHAPQLGMARRSLLHEGTLFGISDDSIQSFDISDRDAPRALDTLEVARNIQSMHLLGDRVLRFSADWNTERTVLDVTSKADANAVKPQGEIDLSAAVDSTRACNASSYWEPQVLVHGDTAYVARRSYRYDPAAGKSEQGMTVYVLDIAAATPAIVHSFEVPSATQNQSLGTMLLTRSALLVGRYTHPNYDSQGNQRADGAFHYEIYDLADPRAPRHVERFQVPAEIASAGWGYGVIGCGLDMGWGFWRGGTDASGSMVSGDIVVSQHEEPLDDDSGRVRYYMDRLDLSDPTQPRMLAKVNIPGKVIHFDRESRLVVTLEDELRETVVSSADDCYWRGSRAYFDWEAAQRGRSATCRIYDRVLNTLQLDGDVATRVSRKNLDEDANTTSVAVSGTRVYTVTIDRVARSSDLAPEDLPSLSPVVHSYLVENDARLRELGQNALPARRAWYSWLNLNARGEHAFVQDSNRMHVVDSSSSEGPKLTTHDMPGWQCSSLQVDESHAWCAMGKQGVLGFKL
jgi:uncharacterized secreted protein with C-terminal beta-propeller domain